MNTHEALNALLPFYLAGTLSEQESAAVKEHLESCSLCTEDLLFWQDVEIAIEAEHLPVKAPQSVLTNTLASIEERQNILKPLRHSWQIIRAQMPLVYKEIWPASFLILMLGFVTTLIADQARFLFAIAPLVSATGLAFIYNKAHDPAFELVLSTPVSQIQLLLARSGLVFGYNFGLVAFFSVGLSLHFSPGLVISLLKDWLAPMTFLSTLGLGISIFIRTEDAVFISYALWLSKYLPQTNEFQRLFRNLSQTILSFWQTPMLLYALSLVIFTLMLIYIQNGFRFIRRLA